MSKGLVRSGPDLFSVKSAKHRAEKSLMPQKNFKKNILCIGAGYVGGPTMTIIANKCSDYKITVVDISKERIAAWNSNELPIFEPGLKDRLLKVRGKNLFFSNDIDTSIDQADIIFVLLILQSKNLEKGLEKRWTFNS